MEFLLNGSALFSFSFPVPKIDFDANNIFKAFFGGPGGFSFEGKPSHLHLIGVFKKCNRKEIYIK